jgi:hypothetical protein
MLAPLIILAVSVQSLLVGAAVLGFVTSGPLGLLPAPIMAIFGWFYLPPIAFLVTVSWLCVRPSWTTGTPRMLLLLASSLVGGVSMWFMGLKQEGQELRWTLGFVTGGAVSGAVAVWYLVMCRRSLDRNKSSELKQA